MVRSKKEIEQRLNEVETGLRASVLADDYLTAYQCELKRDILIWALPYSDLAGDKVRSKYDIVRRIKGLDEMDKLARIDNDWLRLYENKLERELLLWILGGE